MFQSDLVHICTSLPGADHQEAAVDGGVDGGDLLRSAALHGPFLL